MKYIPRGNFWFTFARNNIFLMHPSYMIMGNECNWLFLCIDMIFAAPYVKVYLMDGKRCVGKRKTKIARHTLDPLYQQVLSFPEDYRGKILQVRELLSNPSITCTIRKENLTRLVLTEHKPLRSHVTVEDSIINL